MANNLAYQEELRDEMLDGKIVMMSPRPSVRHSRIAGNIFWIFRNYLNKKRCVPFSDGIDLYLSDKDRFVPDFMVVCDRDKIKSKGVYGSPDLVVEILSPSTAKNDRGYKKTVYESSGVPEYWIVSPSEQSIEVYRLQENRYILDNLYTFYSEEEIEDMETEEKAALVTEFKCHLYNDLVIHLADIFGDLLP